MPQRELQKVKNRVAADAFRGLQSNFFLLLQLGYYEALGGWEFINTLPRELQLVTPEDIRRVANFYFNATNRSVAIYRRKLGAVETDEDFLAMTPEQRQQAVLWLQAAESYSLEGMQRFRADLDRMPDELPSQQVESIMPMIRYLMKKADERIAQLQAVEND